MNNTTVNKRLAFFPEQLQELERVFPEKVLPTTASEAELREYFGMRKVIAYIRESVRRS